MRSSARARGTPRCSSRPVRRREGAARRRSGSRCPASCTTRRHFGGGWTRRAPSATPSAASSRCGRGVPPGLGSYATREARLDGRLAAALMSIQAVKGVEIGDGFALAELRGSQAHDEILPGFVRETNHAGGIEAGVSNGQDIVVRAAMKPLPTLMKPLQSVDLDTGEPGEALVERSDVAAVEALAVVAEAAVAFELARAAGRSSAATRSATSSRRGAPTSSASRGDQRTEPARRPRRLHGSRQDDDRGRGRAAPRARVRRSRRADRQCRGDICDGGGGGLPSAGAARAEGGARRAGAARRRARRRRGRDGRGTGASTGRVRRPRPRRRR